MSYFDHNATAPLLPEAAAARDCLEQSAWHNPSSPYRAAARARNALEEARERLGALLAVPAQELVFTSGATEAANALVSQVAVQGGTAPLWLSPVEHPCVSESVQALLPQRARHLACDAQGRTDPEVLAGVPDRERPAAVFVMAANNETGVLQPWQRWAAVCRQRGVPFCCDAVQWFGRLPAEGFVAAHAFWGSGHKFGGPRGVGFLRLGPEFSGLRLQRGGPQEHDHRAGTENVPGIVAMVTALEAATALLPGGQARARWRDAFEARLARSLGAQPLGAGAERLWNTSMLALPHTDQMRWIARLDRAGFAVSSGSACSTGRSGASAVLRAMGVEEAAARRCVRISAGWATRREDWEALAEAFESAAEALEPRSDDSGHAGGLAIDIVQV